MGIDAVYTKEFITFVPKSSDILMENIQ